MDEKTNPSARQAAEPASGQAAPASPAEAMDKAFEALRRHDWGQDPRALQAIDGARSASRGDPALRKGLEARLSDVLKTDAPLAAKQYVCRTLSRIGSADSVPALAALLTDEHLSHMGRYALERMASPEAAASLRAALPRVSGKIKAGVIHSLGALRDIESAPLLAGLLGDPAPDAAGAAAEALGQIGTPEAAGALRAFLERAPRPLLRGIAAGACLACAERLLAAGEKVRAIETYRALEAPDLPAHVRLAAKLGQSAAATEAARGPDPGPAEPSIAVSPEERLAIEKALPAKAVVPPARPRKLLVFDLNVGYPGHGSIRHANLAFTLMGRKTGAFEAVLSRDPKAFRRESLRRFDAVFLNNTVGNLFEDPELRRSLMEFVVGGGGLLGVHGTSVAFTRWPGAHEDWPEFGRVIGARGARHRESDERVLVKLDDPGHPLNQPFGGKGFEYRDEFFRFDEPYSRKRVRVLFSIDASKTDLKPKGDARPEREDSDYALAWVRGYGKGRVFYSTIAHNPRVFSDPLMLSFYLGAIQFALGDLPAPTLPSARLTPAARAEEKLGWRLGAAPYSFHKFTLFEAIEKTAGLGLSYMGALSFQKVSQEIPKNFEDGLTDEELEKVRLKLDSAGVRLLTYYYHQVPGDEAGCRKVFEFCRKVGIETLISEPLPEALDAIERSCEEYGINLAIHNHGKDISPIYWQPEGVLKACRGRGRRIGACGDLGYWMRSGIDPIEAVRLLGDRVMTLEMHDLDARGPEGHDVPWGTGAGETGRFLEEARRLGLKPTMLGLEYSYDFLDNLPQMARCAEFFHGVARKLAD